MAIHNPDLTKFVRIGDPFAGQSAPPVNIAGAKNPFLRCLVPQAIATNSDSLRQFYQGGIPQYRIIPPKQG